MTFAPQRLTAVGTVLSTPTLDSPRLSGVSSGSGMVLDTWLFQTGCTVFPMSQRHANFLRPSQQLRIAAPLAFLFARAEVMMAGADLRRERSHMRISLRIHHHRIALFPQG